LETKEKAGGYEAVDKPFLCRENNECRTGNEAGKERQDFVTTLSN
jgi:hypothetical protein